MSATSLPIFIRCLSLAALIVVPTFAAAQSSPDDLTPDKAAKLAVLYFKLNQNKECRSALDSLLRRSPDHIGGLILLGKLELREKHAAAADKAATRALTAAPDSMEATVLKAYALRADGKEAEATKLLARVPKSELDTLDDEYQSTTTAATTEPAPGQPVRDAADLLDEKLDLARAALAKKDLALAGKLSAEAYKSAPDDLATGTVRAEVLAESGKPAEAVKILKKFKAAHPANRGPFPADIDLADALNEAGQKDEARSLFTSVANDSRASNDDRKQARAALQRFQVATLVDAGEKALDKGDLATAESSVNEAVKLDATDRDAIALHARVLDATGHSSDAVRKLAEMKASTPKNERFDQQVAYASALENDHQYAASASALREFIDDPQTTDSNRLDARDQLTELQDRHLGGGQIDLLTGTFEEGRLWRATSQLSTTRIGSTRYMARYTWDNVDLSDKLYPYSLTENTWSATVGIDQMLNPKWNVNAFVGGHEDGIIASGGVTYHELKGPTIGLDLAYQAPARDTLLLMAMNGRQNAITATAEMPLGHYFAWDSTLIARQIEAQGTHIGDGYGIESQLRWHPFKVERDIYLAYALELKDFSPKNDAFDREVRSFFETSSPYLPHAVDVVPDHINRHALQVHAAVPLWPKLLASATGEAAWRQETAQLEYGAVAELVWKINDRASMNARFEFYTGGSGPNAGEDVILGTLGSRWTW